MNNENRLNSAKEKAEEALKNIVVQSGHLIQKTFDDGFKVSQENSSKRSKYSKFIRIVDEYSDLCRDHVVCHKGCSHCCNVSVIIYQTEAQKIEAATGRRMSLPDADMSKMNEFQQGAVIKHNIGKPCPFLKDNACSIYENRPVACRIHVNLGDPYYCQPSIPASESFVPEPDVTVLGVAITEALKGDVMADIRDFFPE